ncbi:MAG: 2-phospho-L-lactate transferase [Candidatus Thorarchaeota archaeon]|nr:2-phospho-L-lactate transferase [Candidatus Thorarchaeota archaeon]
MKVVALSGGIGGAKLALGLYKVLEKNELTVIANTGDDIDILGLSVSPDLDILMYTLADMVDTEKGWGIQNDSFNFLTAISEYYNGPDWFNLGDKDLATHVLRTRMLHEGQPLSKITEELANRVGLKDLRLLPMTDDDVQTHVRVEDGSWMHFEEYFVKRGFKDEVREFEYVGSESAKPAKGVLEEIENADGIVVCPSNPIASIGPILSIKAIEDALKKTNSPVVGVTPLIGGRAVKGPTRKFMKAAGYEASIEGVLDYYDGIFSHFVLDVVDESCTQHVRERGLHVLTTNTLMKTLEDKRRLAKEIVGFVAQDAS